MDKPLVLFRLSLCTVLAVAAVWALYLKPTQMLEHIPKFPFIGSSQSIDSVLPIYPKTQLQAFDYGVLVHSLEMLKYYNDSGRMTAEPILKEASALAGRPVSPDVLKSLRETLVEIEAKVSVIQKVWGFFSFINLLWLMAIFGISISILPAIYTFAEPLRKLLFALGERLLEFIVQVVVPFVMRLHENGVFEPFAFIASIILTAQGLRMEPESGMYVTISGLVALNSCPLYSFLLHGEEIRQWIYDNRAWLPCVTMCAFVCPMALHFQSVLLSYLVTAGFWNCLGFTILIFPFSYCFGWQSEDVMLQCASTSAALLQVYAAAKIMRILPPAIACFESPVAVLGSIMLFLCLLIMSNLYYPKNSTPSGSLYMRRNTSFLLCALLAVYLGNVFGMNGLGNTATTFLVLWILEKYCEFHFQMKLNIWLFVLITSIAMYKVALWLHANPGFVVSLFVGFN